jgi:hypothetical protein
MKCPGPSRRRRPHQAHRFRFIKGRRDWLRQRYEHVWDSRIFSAGNLESAGTRKSRGLVGGEAFLRNHVLGIRYGKAVDG